MISLPRLISRRAELKYEKRVFWGLALSHIVEREAGAWQAFRSALYRRCPGLLCRTFFDTRCAPFTVDVVRVRIHSVSSAEKSALCIAVSTAAHVYCSFTTASLPPKKATKHISGIMYFNALFISMPQRYE